MIFYLPLKFIPHGEIFDFLGEVEVDGEKHEVSRDVEEEGLRENSLTWGQLWWSI